MQLERNGKQIRIITKLKNRVVITIDEEKIDLTDDIYEKFDLYVGKTITDKELVELKELTLISKSISYVSTLLRRRRYSELEIKRKLYARGLNSPQISPILNILKDKKMIDDEAMKLELLELEEIKCLGKLRIISDLKTKGFDIDDSYFTFDDELEKAKAQLDAIQRKFVKGSYRSKQIKVAMFLKYKGFENPIIQEAMKSMKEKDLYNEYHYLKLDLEKALLRYENVLDGKLLKERVIKSLLGKGYEYSDIVKALEVSTHENDC